MMRQNGPENVTMHPNIARMVEVWRDERHGAAAPQRGGFSPLSFGSSLSQLFLLGGETAGTETFRIAGALLADLHGEELQGAGFTDLWRASDRLRLTAALQQIRDEAEPVLLKGKAVAADGEAIHIEMVIAPIHGENGRTERVLGLYQPTSITARLCGQRVVELQLTDVESLAPKAASARPMLRLVVDNTRRAAA